jgi:regulator of sigma D
MKIRLGFVSNSSSSSFILSKKNLDEMEDVYKKYFGKKLEKNELFKLMRNKDNFDDFIRSQDIIEDIKNKKENSKYIKKIDSEYIRERLSYSCSELYDYKVTGKYHYWNWIIDEANEILNKRLFKYPSLKFLFLKYYNLLFNYFKENGIEKLSDFHAVIFNYYYNRKSSFHRKILTFINRNFKDINQYLIKRDKKSYYDLFHDFEINHARVLKIIDDKKLIKKLKKIHYRIEKELINLAWKKFNEEIKEVKNSNQDFYLLEITDGGGSGHVSKKICSEEIKIPYFRKFENR